MFYSDAVVELREKISDARGQIWGILEDLEADNGSLSYIAKKCGENLRGTVNLTKIKLQFGLEGIKKLQCLHEEISESVTSLGRAAGSQDWNRRVEIEGAVRKARMVTSAITEAYEEYIKEIDSLSVVPVPRRMVVNFTEFDLEHPFCLSIQEPDRNKGSTCEVDDPSVSMDDEESPEGDVQPEDGSLSGSEDPLKTDESSGSDLLEG